MTLQQLRHEIVLAHIERENAHDFDATVGTFARPRYEGTPTGETLIGDEAVKCFLLETQRAFPDMRFEARAIHHAGEAVMVGTAFARSWLGGH